MNYSKTNRAIIFFFICPILLFSQNNYDGQQFGEEAGDYYSAPLNWEQKDFLAFGLIAAGTFTLMQFDSSIKNEFSKINANRSNWLMEVGRYWGEPIPSLALSGVLLLHGISTNNATTKKIGFEIGQSFIYSVSVTSGLKIMLGRARPSSGSSASTFAPFSVTNSNWSFPSGHNTVAFSLSTVLAANTDNNYLKALAFIPAFLTATSRIYQNHHWASDVFLGAFIGYFTGKFVTDLHKSNEITPTINNTPLVSLSLAF